MIDNHKKNRSRLMKAILILTVALGGWFIGTRFENSGKNRPGATKDDRPLYRDIVGRIQGIDTAKQTIRMDHEKIDGFMDAMVMDLKIADSVNLEKLSVGETVRFDLARVGDHYKVAGIRPHDNESEQPSPTEEEITKPSNPLGRGDRVPNLTLYDSTGERFQLHEMEAESKVITFFYVRCPLETYCPAQSKRLAALQEELDKNGNDVHLLSLTLDAGHDNSEVLDDYAQSFDADPDRWTLAGSENPEAVPDFAHRAGARARQYDNTFQIDHALVALRVENNRIVDRVYGLKAITEMIRGM